MRLLAEELISSGLISPLDTLLYMRLASINFNGTGTVWMQPILSVGNIPYLQRIVVNGVTFAQEIVVPNNSSIEYCNFSGPASPTSSQQLSLSYLYTNVSNSQLKCQLQARTGFLNGTFYTPTGHNGLPINITADYELRSSISFAHLAQQYPNGSSDTTPISAAVCWTLSTRVDYDGATFNNSSNTFPSREIFVCPFWTQAYTKQGVFAKTVKNPDNYAGY